MTHSCCAAGSRTPSQTGPALRAELSWALAARAPWSAVHVLDPLVYQRLRERRGGGGARISLMPDPVPAPPAIAREERSGASEYPRTAGISPARGCSTNARVLTCWSAPLRHPACPTMTVCFSWAGLVLGCPLFASVNAAPDRAGRIIAPDGYMSDEDFSLTMFAADLICTPYPRHIGSASIVIRGRGGEAGTWIRLRVDRLCGSPLWSRKNLQRHGSRGLRCSPSRLPCRRSPVSPDRIGTTLCRVHSPDNYRATWTLRLRGNGASQSQRTNGIGSGSWRGRRPRPRVSREHLWPGQSSTERAFTMPTHILNRLLPMSLRLNSPGRAIHHSQHPHLDIPARSAICSASVFGPRQSWVFGARPGQVGPPGVRNLARCDD